MPGRADPKPTESSNSLPNALPLVVTMGDAAGIGPEIIVRAFERGALADAVVAGDAAVLRRAGAAMTALIDEPSDLAAVPPGCLPVLAVPGLPAGLAALPWGRIDARCGAAAARCIEQAVHWVRAGKAAAIVTAPVHKEALAAAGVPYPGHTEMLQALSAGAPDATDAAGATGAANAAGAAGAAGADHRPPPVRMMLANDELRVVLVTIHISLRRALELLDFDAVLSTIVITHDAGRRFGIDAPRIAVAGLNPHAGEGGLFGDEEIRYIGPAVQAARARGIDAHGPFAPDTVFMRARRGEFDFVVAMTHDHGLIPVKYLGVQQGVNVTLGLPFVRTSPDHGTAFDIAGRGIADPASLLSALKWARRLAGQRIDASPASAAAPASPAAAALRPPAAPGA